MAALGLAAVAVAAVASCRGAPGPDPRALGALCSRDEECASVQCVEGVCCDRVCDSGCEACNVVGATGTCVPTPGPSGACDDGGVCSALAACAGGHRWSLLSGSAGVDEITAATRGPVDDLVVGGRFTAELRFGAEPILVGDPNRASAFVMRLDALRMPRWAISLGVGATVGALVDDGGVLYVAGTHTGSAPLLGEPRQAAGVDGYVAAIDEEGVRWVWFLDGPGTQRIDRLAPLPDGGLVVGARQSDLAEAAPTLSATVVALGPDGSLRWSVPIASAGNDRVGAIAVDDAGRIVVTGSVNGPVSLGGETLDHRGAEDVFVVRLSSQGVVDGAWSYGGTGSDVGQAVVVAPDGDLFVAGFFTKAIDFGDGPMLSAGCEDVFLARLDSEGRARFSRRFGDAEPEVVGGLAMTSEGTLVAAGDFEGSLDFGWGPLVGRGGLDLWVASWTLEGEPLWATAFGGPDRERAQGVVLTDAGVVVAGRAQGALELGDATLVPVGGADGFITELTR